MKNKIEDLRNHLFATIEALSDPEKPMEIERARAIADVGRVIVDSAKAEVQFIKETGASRGTGFILPSASEPPANTTPPSRWLGVPIGAGNGSNGQRNEG